MKTFAVVFSLLLLLIVLLFSAYFVYEERVYTFRSRAMFQQISADNSLAVSVPSCVLADGIEISRLHVYCLSARGLGEPNATVRVTPTDSAQGLQVKAVQAVTDETGRATFDVTSSVEGNYDLTIVCGETVIKTDHKTCFHGQ